MATVEKLSGTLRHGTLTTPMQLARSGVGGFAALAAIQAAASTLSPVGELPSCVWRAFCLAPSAAILRHAVTAARSCARILLESSESLPRADPTASNSTVTPNAHGPARDMIAILWVTFALLNTRAVMAMSKPNTAP